MQASVRCVRHFNLKATIAEVNSIHHYDHASHSLRRSFSSTSWHREATDHNPRLGRRPHEGSRGKEFAYGGAAFGAVALLGAAYSFSETKSSSGKIFDPPRFTPFSIVDREEISSDCILLTVRPQNASFDTKNSDPYASWWQKGTWSVEVKQPQLQIARAYTPLPPRETDMNGELRFLIRKERNGEVSGYLHRLRVGDVVEMRGPNTELELGNDLTDVVFLAGGTGIAPAMQVAHTLLERRDATAGMPNVRIVWANRKRVDCVGGYSGPSNSPDATGRIVGELLKMQSSHPENLSVSYVVDEERTYLDRRMIAQITKPSSKVTSQAVHNKIGLQLLVLSGPDGFITHFAGKKLWDGGQDGQGDLGGVIGSMGLRGWKVWKL